MCLPHALSPSFHRRHLHCLTLKNTWCVCPLPYFHPSIPVISIVWPLKTKWCVCPLPYLHPSIPTISIVWPLNTTQCVCPLPYLHPSIPAISTVWLLINTKWCVCSYLIYILPSPPSVWPLIHMSIWILWSPPPPRLPQGILMEKWFVCQDDPHPAISFHYDNPLPKYLSFYHL